MRQLQPVLWTKGVLLTPHHLQAQDRFVEDLLDFQVAAFAFCPWGVHRLAVDLDALAGGTVVLTAVGGRFPDGLLFDAPPGEGPAPKPLDGAWGPDQRALTVHLAVPEYRPGGRNVGGVVAPAGDAWSAPHGAGAGAAASPARWRADEVLRRDETTGLAERPVQVALGNLRLLVEGESLEGYATMPLLRVVRGAAGELALDPSFVPPLLDVQASPVLAAMGRRLLERLAAKTAALSGARRQRSAGLADFTVADVAPFWLLYTLNTHFPQLRHVVEAPRAHPAQLWEAMAALAGALTTFSPTLAVRTLPAYDHARLGPAFAELEARLLELLETAVPETTVALPLRLVSPSVHAVAVEQDAWLSAPQWYLAVRSGALRPAELVPRVLHGCKVGAADVVDTLIRQALPGLELAHVPQPPSAVPVKLDAQYFALRRAGAAWDAVARARSLAVYAPAELPDVRFELVIVLR